MYVHELFVIASAQVVFQANRPTCAGFLLAMRHALTCLLGEFGDPCVCETASRHTESRQMADNRTLLMKLRYTCVSSCLDTIASEETCT